MGGEDPMGGGCDADISVMSSGGMHQHSLLVTAAQIAAGTDVTILSGESQSHSHQVKITAADFTALKAGMEVKKKSCAGGDHEYVLKCGGGGSTPVVPTDCTDECGGPDAASACP
jgi:hydroxymethylpyrimidine/phosphomethylpyrimidine kinase